MSPLALIPRPIHAMYRAGWVAFVMCLMMLPGAVLKADPLEYAVKAAYLTKFGIYVEWPGATFPSPDSPINLCIVGEDPFGPALDKAASNQHIGTRAITIRRLKTVTRESGCQILYIGSTDAAYIEKAIEAIRGSAVLTVTDVDSAMTMGVINFVIQDNHVHFNVDESAATQNDLTLSAKLLSLALNVKARH
jgi:hypothetical protein